VSSCEFCLCNVLKNVVDYAGRLEFSCWISKHPELCPHILFADEAQFSRHGVNNMHNSHSWSEVNPPETTDNK